MDKGQSIALVGAGYWGKNLVRNFTELGALKIICDSNADLLKDFKARYSDVEVSESYEAILNDHAIKGVVIATPAVEHYSMAKRALLPVKMSW